MAVVLPLLVTGSPVMADDVADRFPLAVASEGAPHVELAFGAAPALRASTFNPPGFVWDSTTSEPQTFAGAGVFTSFIRTHLGYDPSNRDRYEVTVYVADLEPDRVAPAAGIAVLLASQWGALNFGIHAPDSGFGEVLGGSDASGEMIVSRISVWRRGLQVLVLRQTFKASDFDTYRGVIAQVAGSLRFDTPSVVDPALAAVHKGRITAGSVLFDFRLPSNWSRLADGATGTPMAAEVWYDAADPNGNAGAMVMAAPPAAPVADGQRPDARPDQHMFDLAATVARVLVENVLPGAQTELQPREMNSFTSLDDITIFNRFLVFDARLNSKTQVVIGVTIVMPADGSTLISATLSPAAENLYLLGTQRHVDLVNALLLEDMLAHASAVVMR